MAKGDNELDSKQIAALLKQQAEVIAKLEKRVDTEAAKNVDLQAQVIEQKAEIAHASKAAKVAEDSTKTEWQLRMDRMKASVPEAEEGMVRAWGWTLRNAQLRGSIFEFCSEEADYVYGNDPEFVPAYVDLGQDAWDGSANPEATFQESNIIAGEVIQVPDNIQEIEQNLPAPIALPAYSNVPHAHEGYDQGGVMRIAGS